MTLTLSLACGPFDRTLPLLDGTVVPEGIRLQGIGLTPGEMFRRQAPMPSSTFASSRCRPIRC